MFPLVFATKQLTPDLPTTPYPDLCLLKVIPPPNQKLPGATQNHSITEPKGTPSPVNPWPFDNYQKASECLAIYLLPRVPSVPSFCSLFAAC